jgi:hypothetical protein
MTDNTPWNKGKIVTLYMSLGIFTIIIHLDFRLGLLTREDGPDTSRNVGKQLPHDAA